jgi:Transposase zinc-binding domain
MDFSAQPPPMEDTAHRVVACGVFFTCRRYFVALAYERNQPEKTILHEVITRTWPRIVSDYAAADQKVPYHVVQEMENYLKCGMLEFGFIHLACSDCGKERVLG